MANVISDTFYLFLINKLYKIQEYIDGGRLMAYLLYIDLPK